MANEVGLGRRVNMVMQAAFFGLSGVVDINEVRWLVLVIRRWYLYLLVVRGLDNLWALCPPYSLVGDSWLHGQVALCVTVLA